MSELHESSAVVIGEYGLPAEALPVLRAAAEVYTADQAPSELTERAREHGVVLLCPDGSSAAAQVMRAAGAPVYGPVPGEALYRAVAVMDRLRSPGGCPWDAEQTHESLRRYLVEETYELLEAIENEDRAELREELGDVLLQVLFHARVAAEHTADPFTIEDVADGLVRKLVGRHRHVFGSDLEHVADADAQQQRWEVLKQAEKQRESVLDGVALGQPATALAGKLVSRVSRAGFPTELCAEDEASGDDAELFAAVARIAAEGRDPEGELREYAKWFADRVRRAEIAAAQDQISLDADAWRQYWK
ncbi:MazG family protein [Sciscionella marina]|uniref:MazG family protein n=1 Tax=Sciscionella marina TaxID=508770 RepID=UPI00036E9985|nr:MazG family protein [Sciscionella marina]